MRYLDSGARDAAQSLGYWLQETLNREILEVRWQSGYFVADGLGFLAPTLERLRTENQLVVAVVGSNDGSTLRTDLERLLPLLGIPRTNAHLGVVSYSGAYFHPKTYHLRREDGSQAAYVGSANLTPAGMAALHVEAGIVLDTREGDAQLILSEIATAIDAWTLSDREGFTRIRGAETLDQLVAEGILALAPAAPDAAGGEHWRTRRPRLRPLVRIPAFGPPPSEELAVLSHQAPAATSVPRAGLPEYLLFDPTADSPTRGALALSGSQLPSGAQGLIIRLNADSARYFSNRTGTANISLPVATATTLRFGLFHGRYDRPRAEFAIRMRFIDATGLPFEVQGSVTNVMAYGVRPGESGHRDLRMLVPASPARAIAARVRQAGLPVPADGDVAILEWPTASVSEFRLTFLERGSPLFAEALTAFEVAEMAGQIVGAGACWLRSGLSPAW